MKYEIVSIVDGYEYPVYATEDKAACIKKIAQARNCRLKIDGEIQTIREADAFCEGKRRRPMPNKAEKPKPRKAAVKTGKRGMPHGTAFYLYTIKNPKTGELVAEDVTAREGAKILNMQLDTFYWTSSRCNCGRKATWDITRRKARE